MAGVFFNVSTEGEVACVAATAKTVIRVTAPANQAVKVLGYGIYFDGVTAAAEPVQVRLRKSTTAGTSTAVTPRRVSGPSVTIQSTSGKNFSAEGTDGDIIHPIEVHPTSGYEKMFPMGQEVVLGGAERLGLKVTAPANVNCEAILFCEE